MRLENATSGSSGRQTECNTQSPIVVSTSTCNPRATSPPHLPAMPINTPPNLRPLYPLPFSPHSVRSMRPPSPVQELKYPCKAECGSETVISCCETRTYAVGMQCRCLGYTTSGRASSTYLQCLVSYRILSSHTTCSGTYSPSLLSLAYPVFSFTAINQAPLSRFRPA